VRSAISALLRVVLAVSTLTAAACSPRLVTPDADPVGYPASGGWVSVHQEGWYRVELPAPPRVDQVAVPSAGEAQHAKRIIWKADGALASLVYFESAGGFVSPRAQVMADVRAALVQSAGVKLVRETGAESKNFLIRDIDLDVAPNSESNPTPHRLLARARVLVGADRAYTLLVAGRYEAPDPALQRILQTFVPQT
jgi:hypothetical protein